MQKNTVSSDSLFLRIFNTTFIYLFLVVWVSIALHGLSLVAASGCYSSLWWAGPSLAASLNLEHRDQAHRLSSCGTQTCLLHSMWDLQHWQVDSYLLYHQRSPLIVILKLVIRDQTSIILILSSTINLQFQGQFVPIFLRSVLGIMAV